MSYQTASDRVQALRNIRGGRLTKWKGVVASCAPTMGAVVFAISTLGLAGAANAANECGVISGPDAIIVCDGIAGNAGTDGSFNVNPGSDVGDIAPSGPIFTEYLNPAGSSSLTLNIEEGVNAFGGGNTTGILKAFTYFGPFGVPNYLNDDTVTTNMNGGTLRNTNPGQNNVGAAIQNFTGTQGNAVMNMTGGLLINGGAKAYTSGFSAAVTMSGGEIRTESGWNTDIGLFAQGIHYSEGAITVDMSGGLINFVDSTFWSGAVSVGGYADGDTPFDDVSVTMRGDAQLIIENSVMRNNGSGLNASTNGFSTNATVTQDGVDSLVSFDATSSTIPAFAITANSGAAAYVSGTGIGTASVIQNAGAIIVLGTDINGVTAISVGGNTVVDVADRVTGGSGNAAALATIGTMGTNTIDIRSTAVVDGSLSGIAIRDGYALRGTSDDAAGAATVTSAGTVTGDAVLGLGNDTFNLTGGTFTGDIFGDERDNAASNDTVDDGEGNDAFNWSAGTLVGGFNGQDGSDTALITAAEYDGTHILDGGDDLLAADGMIDALTLQGLTASTASTTLLNWETVVVDGGSLVLTDNMLAVGSDAGTGLTLTNGGVLDAGSMFALTGNLTTSADGTFDGTGGGTGVYTISGSVLNDGIITTQDDVVGDVITIAGDYAGTGMLLVDADFSMDTVDTLVINGNVTGGITTLGVNSIIADPYTSTGNDVQVVTVAGASPAGLFMLDSGPITIGSWDYSLEQVGTDWFLTAICATNQTASGASAAVPGCVTADTLTVTTGAMIAGDVEGAGDVDIILVDGDATVTGIVRGGGDGVDMSALTDLGDFITIDTTGTVGGVDGDLGDDQIWVLAGTVTGDVLGNVGDDQITLNGATAMVDGTIDGGIGNDAINLLDGTVNAVSGGDGNDIIVLNGATVTTGISGGLGDDTFTWTSGATTSFDGGDGSDVMNISSGADLSGLTLLDGGDDLSPVDTFIDVLSVDGLTGPVDGTIIRNWEEINVANSDIVVTDLVAGDVNVTDSTVVATNLTADEVTLTDSDTTIDGTSVVATVNTCGGITTLTGSTAATDVLGCASDDTIVIDGDAVVANAIEGAGGDDSISVLGNASVATINVAGDGSDVSALTDAGNTVLVNTTGTVGTILGGEQVDEITLTAGTVGPVLAGGGDDTIVADGADVTSIDAGAGDDTATWSAGTVGSIALGLGSDTLTVTAVEYDGTQILDGGDDVGSADGMIDTLTLDGLTVSAASTALLNWETLIVDGGSLELTDNMLTVGSDAGTGLILTNDAVLDAGGMFDLTGNLTTSAGGTFDGTGGGTGVYTISGSVLNNGIITTLDGVVGDVITIAGNYSGTGTLLVDADTATDMVDALVITGNVTGGPTTVVVNNLSPLGATGNTLTVITVGGTSAAGDFVLDGGSLTAGAFDYSLVKLGSDFVLASAVNSTGAVYQATPMILGAAFNRLPTLEQRVGQRQWAGTNVAQGALEPSTGGWLRLHGDRLNAATSTGSSTKSTTWGLQAGVDFKVEPSDEGQWVLGVTGQYGQLNSTITNPLGFGNIDATGFGVGATATWYGNAGTYVDLQGQVNWIDSDFSSSAAGALAEGELSKAYAVSAEVGHRFELDQNTTLVPQAQLTFGKIQGASFTDNAGNAVDLGSNTSTIGRLGLAYEYENNDAPNGDRKKAYVIGNILHDFSKDSVVNVAGANLSSSVAEKTWGEIGLGGSYTFDANKTLYGEASYRRAFGGGSSNNGLAATVGLRVQW